MNPVMEDLLAMISVDVETAGPNPGSYALLSIGACTLGQPRQTFYVELKPDRLDFQPQAMEIHRLDLDGLAKKGLNPKEALLLLEQWLNTVVPEGRQPIFLAFNAPFDWMFLNDYFHRYLARNPFGHSALDIKAFYMGASKSRWCQTSGDEMRRLFLNGKNISHNALEDAIDQAILFERILDQYFV
jgi:DNA polymerase III epsilon subunit-like protein